MHKLTKHKQYQNQISLHIYNLPESSIDSILIENLIPNVTKINFIMEDFNGHNPLWGSNKINQTGKYQLNSFRNII